MGNLGVSIIGLLMIVFGMIAGYVNSFLIMQLIGATTTMWVLWVSSGICVIIGSILIKLAEDK